MQNAHQACHQLKFDLTAIAEAGISNDVTKKTEKTNLQKSLRDIKKTFFNIRTDLPKIRESGKGDASSKLRLKESVKGMEKTVSDLKIDNRLMEELEVGTGKDSLLSKKGKFQKFQQSLEDVETTTLNLMMSTPMFQRVGHGDP